MRIYSGGFDTDTMQNTTVEASLGVEPASLRILCHNSSNIPVILDELEVLNDNTGEAITRHDAKAARIDAHGCQELSIPIDSPGNHFYKPPSWRARIRLRTVRKQQFSSTPFSFADLL